MCVCVCVCVSVPLCLCVYSSWLILCVLCGICASRGRIVPNVRNNISDDDSSLSESERDASTHAPPRISDASRRILGRWFQKMRRE